MTITYLPPTHEIRELFIDEVLSMGCIDPEINEDRYGLYARAAFSNPVEVKPGDAVRGGVALRTMDALIDVHPFIYRQICENGAIVVGALESRHVERVDFAAPSLEITAVLENVRWALRACGQPDVFMEAAEAMRRATREAAASLMGTAFMLAQQRGITGASVDHAFVRIASETRGTAFDLINAITSLARETRDAAQRWRLEELGGGMLAFIAPARKSGPAGAQLPEDELIDIVA